MRVIAAAAIAAIASAGLAEDLEKAGWEFSCGVWKGTTSVGKGWTAETVNNKTIYKDADGKEITNWSSYDGYSDSKCDKLGAAYLTAAAATVAAVAALAF